MSIRKTYPMQAYKIMHGLWGMGQMMFTKDIVVVDAECLRTATMTCTTPATSSSASAPIPTRNAIQFSPKGRGCSGPCNV